MAKHEQIDRLNEEFAGLINAIDGMDEEAMTIPAIGEWGVREVLAHIAGWMLIDTEIMRRLARGERPFAEGEEYGTGESRNPGYARGAALKRAGDVVSDLHTAFGELVTAATALPDARFAVGHTAQRLIEESVCEHMKEHRIAIEAHRRTPRARE